MPSTQRRRNIRQRNQGKAEAIQPVLAPEFALVVVAVSEASLTEQGEMVDALQADFEQYHRENPQVYRAFKAKAEQLRREGRARLSGKYIVERLRWDTPVGANEPRDFKLTNSYTSRYVRVLIAEDATFAPYFRLRPLLTPVAA